MLPLARPGLWLAGAAVIALVIAVGSLVPGPLVAAVSGYDKLEHLGAHLVLTLWLAGLVERRHYVRAALTVLLFGIGVELAQGAFTATREPELADVAANAAGVGLALALALAGAGNWTQRVEAWLGWRRR